MAVGHSGRVYREDRAPRANHTVLPRQPGQEHSGTAVAYPGPKIVTVTSPTNELNRTRQPHLDLHA